MLLFMISRVIIVLSAIVVGIVGVVGVNFVEQAAGKLTWIIYTIVGLAGLLQLFNRDFYLPFLGETAFPCVSLMEKIPVNANTEVKIRTLPNVNVIYWAAENNDKISPNPMLAYGKYENAGVARSDAEGIVALRVRYPGEYKVGMINRKLDRHIHYRVCAGTGSGLLGRIETVMLP